VAGRGERNALSAVHDIALGDDGDVAQPAVALGAFDDVDLRASPEKVCPVYARLCRVEQSAEQPIPLPDGDDVRGESDYAVGLRRL
jgi:hypothetical protein